MDRHELENLRRSVVMAPPDSPAPMTCRDAADLIRQLQEAEAEVRRLRD